MKWRIKEIAFLTLLGCASQAGLRLGVKDLSAGTNLFQRGPASEPWTCINYARKILKRARGLGSASDFDSELFQELKALYSRQGIPQEAPKNSEAWLAAFEARGEAQGLLTPTKIQDFLEVATKGEQKKFRTLLKRLGSQDGLSSSKFEAAFADYYALVYRIHDSEEGYAQKIMLRRLDKELKMRPLKEVLESSNWFKDASYFDRWKQRTARSRKVFWNSINIILNASTVFQTGTPAYLPKWERKFSAAEIDEVLNLLETQGSEAAKEWFFKQVGPRALAEKTYNLVAKAYNTLMLSYFFGSMALDLREKVIAARNQGKEQEKELRDLFSDLDHASEEIEAQNNKSPDEIAIDGILDRLRQVLEQSGKTPVEIENEVSAQRKLLTSTINQS